MDPNWAEITAAVGAAVTGGAALLGLQQLWRVRRGRMARTLVERRDAWDDRVLRAARADFARNDSAQLTRLVQAASSAKKDAATTARLRTAEAIPRWLEGVAVLQKEGGVSLGLVDRHFGDAVIETWQKWQPAALVLRRQQPAAYAELEELVERIQQRRAWWSGSEHGDRPSSSRQKKR
jgi:hypothetical protein